MQITARPVITCQVIAAVGQLVRAAEGCSPLKGERAELTQEKYVTRYSTP